MPASPPEQFQAAQQPAQRRPAELQDEPQQAPLMMELRRDARSLEPVQNLAEQFRVLRSAPVQRLPQASPQS